MTRQPDWCLPRAVRGALTLLLVLAALHPLHAQRQGGQDEEAIRALIQQTEDANNAGDVGGWVSLFAADAVYMPPGVPAITTREGLIAVARAGFRNQASIHIEPLEIRVCGDWAFVWSRVEGKVTHHGSGESIPVDMKQLVIYHRGEHGEWRIARMISNRNTE